MKVTRSWDSAWPWWGKGGVVGKKMGGVTVMVVERVGMEREYSFHNWNFVLKDNVVKGQNQIKKDRAS